MQQQVVTAGKQSNHVFTILVAARAGEKREWKLRAADGGMAGAKSVSLQDYAKDLRLLESNVDGAHITQQKIFFLKKKRNTSIKQDIH